MSTQFEMFRVRTRFRVRVRVGARALTAAAREADWAIASASCLALGLGLGLGSGLGLGNPNPNPNPNLLGRGVVRVAHTLVQRARELGLREGDDELQHGADGHHEQHRDHTEDAHAPAVRLLHG